jgi:beta-lactam-binding protein with PASTA domain
MALAGTPAESFPSYTIGPATPKQVTWRDNHVELDNGNCRNVFLLEYFGTSGPIRKANCKPNEVDVPTVIGYTLAKAKARLALQPLTASVVFKPAKPGQPIDRVIDQFPRTGTLSSFQTVTLVFAKPLHGVVPRLIGFALGQARHQLRASGLDFAGPTAAPPNAVVISQWPRPGVAAAPHMRVKLMIATANG